MKKSIFTAILISSIHLFGYSQTATRRTLITLQPGERVMYAESCLAMTVTSNQYYLVTKIGEKIYIYENGQKRGPFEEMADIDMKNCQEENYNSQCSLYEDEAAGYFETENVISNSDGTYSIKLKDKKYGPYPLISNLYIWPDNSGFVAVAIDQEMNSHVITSEGLNLKLIGGVEKLQISPTGKNFVFAFKEKEKIDQDLLTMDFSKMSQEELMEFAKKQEEKQKNAPKLQSYIYVNGVTKLGPYDIDAFYSDNPAYTKTGGTNWIMTLDNSLYINGTKIKSFPDLDLNTCNIWVSRDGKRYVIFSYNKVVFSDGEQYNNPIKPSAIEKDGKVIVSWVSLENEKDLVFYSRTL